MENPQPIAELEETILKANQGSFVADQRRPDAARALEVQGLQGLGVIGSYRMSRGNFDVEEPQPEVETILDEVWRKNIAPYTQQPIDALVRGIAGEILGRTPSDDEVLPTEQYERVYSTFHSIALPRIVIGRLDNDMFAKSAPKYTLQRILTGLKVFDKLEKSA